jgi:hypothetical protein
MSVGHTALLQLWPVPYASIVYVYVNRKMSAGVPFDKGAALLAVLLVCSCVGVQVVDDRRLPRRPCATCCRGCLDGSVATWEPYHLDGLLALRVCGSHQVVGE